MQEEMKEVKRSRRKRYKKDDSVKSAHLGAFLYKTNGLNKRKNSDV